MPSFNNLENYILLVEDALPSELCDALLAEYAESSDWKNALVTGGVENKDIRHCQVIKSSESASIDKNKEVRQKLDAALFESSNKVVNQYVYKFGHCAIARDYGYDLLKYSAGGFYTEHVDSYTEGPRTLSCSFVLNDDFAGGEFSFFNQQVKYKIPKGGALLFPSTFLYPHAVLPVTKGTRYAVITWFH